MSGFSKAVSHGRNEDWTVVLPRRGKWKMGCFKNTRPLPEKEHPWAPIDTEIDPARDLKLFQKMEVCIHKLEGSQFYRNFVDQIHTPVMSDSLQCVLGSESKMQMVIYGIGSIESFESPRLQLSLAILMKRNLSWISDVQVFDPIISITESRVLQSLGCLVLKQNEHGKRSASIPTMFFMPHCEANLYENLLKANWEVSLLKNIILLGNSLGTYQEQAVLGFNMKHILAVRNFSTEINVCVSSDRYFHAFNELGWHFFNPNSETGLPLAAGIVK